MNLNSLNQIKIKLKVNGVSWWVYNVPMHFSSSVRHFCWFVNTLVEQYFRMPVALAVKVQKLYFSPFSSLIGTTPKTEQLWCYKVSYTCSSNLGSSCSFLRCQKLTNVVSYMGSGERVWNRIGFSLNLISKSIGVRICVTEWHPTSSISDASTSNDTRS